MITVYGTKKKGSLPLIAQADHLFNGTDHNHMGASCNGTVGFKVNSALTTSNLTGHVRIVVKFIVVKTLLLGCVAFAGPYADHKNSAQQSISGPVAAAMAWNWRHKPDEEKEELVRRIIRDSEHQLAMTWHPTPSTTTRSPPVASLLAPERWSDAQMNVPGWTSRWPKSATAVQNLSCCLARQALARPV
jgi:hypothetical protein